MLSGYVIKKLISTHTHTHKGSQRKNGRQGNLNYSLSPVVQGPLLESHQSIKSWCPYTQSARTLIHTDEGPQRDYGGQRNSSLLDKGSSCPPPILPKLWQETLSPMGRGTLTHCVNREALWRTLQTEGIAACTDTGHTMGCKGRALWDCIEQ